MLTSSVDSGGRIFSPDESKLALVLRDSTIWMWNVGTGQEEWTTKRHSTTNNLLFSPDGSHLVLSSYESSLEVWDAATGHVKQILKKTTGAHMMK